MSRILDTWPGEIKSPSAAIRLRKVKYRDSYWRRAETGQGKKGRRGLGASDEWDEEAAESIGCDARQGRRVWLVYGEEAGTGRQTHQAVIYEWGQQKGSGLMWYTLTTFHSQRALLHQVISKENFKHDLGTIQSWILRLMQVIFNNNFGGKSINGETERLREYRNLSCGNVSNDHCRLRLWEMNQKMRRKLYLIYI